jgi:hypothetical protein
MALRTWAVDELDADRRPFAPAAEPGAERPSGAHPGRRAKWAAGIVVAGLFGATLGYLVNDEIQANDRYDQARASLTLTRQQIGTVSQELAVARRDLQLVLAQVGNDTTALSQDTSQLKAAQAALSAALGHVSRQTTQIGSLNVCLGGVEQAVNALAVGRQAKAISALRAVSSSCTKATAGG